MNRLIVHDGSSGRFFLEEAGGVAYLKYSLQDKSVIDLLSVQVPPPLEGKGIAATLTLSALNYARDAHLKVIPTCPYVKVYIERHAEWQEFLL
ncbi:MAG: GNAT family N-acetyltransferase [Phocaeicola sp.]